MTTDARRRAERALEEVMHGRAVPDAVSIVAASERVTGEQVIDDVRASRYLLVNACNPLTPLERNAPADVIVIRLRPDAASQARVTSLLAQLGISGYSTVPCLFAFEPARAVLGDDVTTTIPAGYREVRVEDARGADWLDDAPPADRRRSVREWGLHRVPPPFEADP